MKACIATEHTGAAQQRRGATQPGPAPTSNSTRYVLSAQPRRLSSQATFSSSWWKDSGASSLMRAGGEEWENEAGLMRHRLKATLS